jgi:hypothetical protein
MVINGERYTSDLILYPNRVDASWWRTEGHRVGIEDIKEIVNEQPEYLVIGTGEPGMMRVPPETRDYLQRQQIQLVVEPTEWAGNNAFVCSCSR